jgi:hypothetical protein
MLEELVTKKLFTIFASLILSGAVAFAQSSDARASARQSPDQSKSQSSSDHGNKQITGCLSKGQGGDYFVASRQDQLVYRLVNADKSKLDEYVGEEVTVNGNVTFMTSPSDQTGRELGSGIANGSNAGSPASKSLMVDNIHRASHSNACAVAEGLPNHQNQNAGQKNTR